MEEIDFLPIPKRSEVAEGDIVVYSPFSRNYAIIKQARVIIDGEVSFMNAVEKIIKWIDEEKLTELEDGKIIPPFTPEQELNAIVNKISEEYENGMVINKENIKKYFELLGSDEKEMILTLAETMLKCFVEIAKKDEENEKQEKGENNDTNR